MNEKINKMAEVLGFDPADLSLDTPTEALDLDSIAILSVLSLARANGKEIVVERIVACRNVAELLELAF